MRNVRSRWNEKIQKRNLQKFNFDDISTFLFGEDPLAIDTFPFSIWKNSHLKNTSVTFQIKHTMKDNIIIKDTFFVITKINHKKVTSDNLKILPLTILSYLYYYYISQIIIWEKYFYDNIKEYCETSVSKMKWNEVKYSGSYIRNNDAKAIWITICDNLDREFWTKFAISLRESILPWLNAEMYKSYKDNQGNKRINVEYDRQRQLMAEGDMTGMDIPIPEDIAVQLKRDIPISFKGSSFSEEDLDVIKVGK